MTAKSSRIILKFLGYSAFFLVCFVLSLAITFPYNRLIGFAETKAEQALDTKVRIDGLRPTITGALRLEGVTLGPSLSPRPDAAGAGAPWVRADTAVVDISYLGLLLGSYDIDFEAELAGGQAEGSFELDESHMALKLKLLDLQAQQIPLLHEKVGLPVTGALTTEVDLDVPVGAANKAEGSLSFSLQGAVIGDGEAKLSLSSLMGYGGRGSSSSSDEGQTIQPIKLGPIAFQSKIDDGEIDIPQITSSSEHAELTFEGQIKLAEPLSRTRVDTYLTVKLLDAYAEQDEETASLISLANAVGRSAKRPDGAFGFRISGSLLRGLSFRPSRSFSVPGRRRGARPGRSSRPNPRSRRRSLNRRRPPGSRAGRPAPRPSQIDSPISTRRNIRSPVDDPEQDDENADDESTDTYPSGMPRRATPAPPPSFAPRFQEVDTDDDTSDDQPLDEEEEELVEDEEEELIEEEEEEDLQ